MRRVRLTNLGSRITVTAVAICVGTVLVIYLYTVTIGGAASGLGAVKGQILIGGLIAVALALILGLYYAQMAASNISRLQDAARKVADGNFETTIPIASAVARASSGVVYSFSFISPTTPSSSPPTTPISTSITTRAATPAIRADSPRK